MPDRKTKKGEWVEWELVREFAKPRDARDVTSYRYAEQDKVKKLETILRSAEKGGPDEED
jgi:hypothetical protein